MNGGQLPTNQLRDINWGALNHASCALQLMSCNYYVCVCVCVLLESIVVFSFEGMYVVML